MKTTYIADGFTEKTLSGFSLCNGPVYNLNGKEIFDTTQNMKSFGRLYELRKDLKIVSLAQVKAALTDKIGEEKCDSLFTLLGGNSILSVQSLDSFWQSVDCDFIMVMHIKDAMHIKTFNNKERKRVRLEAELWKCKDQEVIWRTEVFGIADGDKLTDRETIDLAVMKAYSELPGTIPSYENEKW